MLRLIMREEQNMSCIKDLLVKIIGEKIEVDASFENGGLSIKAWRDPNPKDSNEYKRYNVITEVQDDYFIVKFVVGVYGYKNVMEIKRDNKTIIYSTACVHNIEGTLLKK